MPQEFRVLQCYQCSTFQVHQKKKENKWNCKMCGEKQSLKKIFGCGSGAECRQHVQRLNTLRGSLENIAAEQQEASYCETEDTLAEGSYEPCAEWDNDNQSGRWSRFMTDQNDQSDDDEELDIKYFTSKPEFDRSRKDVDRQRGRKRKREIKLITTQNQQESPSSEQLEDYDKHCIAARGQGQSSEGQGFLAQNASTWKSGSILKDPVDIPQVQTAKSKWDKFSVADVESGEEGTNHLRGQGQSSEGQDFLAQNASSCISGNILKDPMDSPQVQSSDEEGTSHLCKITNNSTSYLDDNQKFGFEGKISTWQKFSPRDKLNDDKNERDSSSAYKEDEEDEHIQDVQRNIEQRFMKMSKWEKFANGNSKKVLEGVSNGVHNDNNNYSLIAKSSSSAVGKATVSGVKFGSISNISSRDNNLHNVSNYKQFDILNQKYRLDSIVSFSSSNDKNPVNNSLHYKPETNQTLFVTGDITDEDLLL